MEIKLSTFNQVMDRIKKLHENNPIELKKVYGTGVRVRETVPYRDTRNLHNVEQFYWINYGDDGHGIYAHCQYRVMYDSRATDKERDWFDQKCTDLFNLGFAWSESSGSFYLSGIWSTWWEQVNLYDKKRWAEYLGAVNESIERKKSPFFDKSLGETLEP